MPSTSTEQTQELLLIKEALDLLDHVDAAPEVAARVQAAIEKNTGRFESDARVGLGLGPC